MPDGTSNLPEASDSAWGDPTLLGWLITLSYFVAAWYTLRAGSYGHSGATPPVATSNRIEVVRGAREVGRARAQAPQSSELALLAERITWRLLSAVCLALGLNKQLDLLLGKFLWKQRNYRAAELLHCPRLRSFELLQLCEDGADAFLRRFTV